MPRKVEAAVLVCGNPCWPVPLGQQPVKRPPNTTGVELDRGLRGLTLKPKCKTCESGEVSFETPLIFTNDIDAAENDHLWEFDSAP